MTRNVTLDLGIALGEITASRIGFMSIGKLIENNIKYYKSIGNSDMADAQLKSLRIIEAAFGYVFDV